MWGMGKTEKVKIIIDNNTDWKCEIYARAAGVRFKKLRKSTLVEKSRVEDTAEIRFLYMQRFNAMQLFWSVLNLEFVTENKNRDRFDLDLRWVAPCYAFLSSDNCMENDGNTLPLQKKHEGLRVDGYVVYKRAKAEDTTTYVIEHEKSSARVLEVLQQDHDLLITRNLDSNGYREITIKIEERGGQLSGHEQKEIDRLLRKDKLLELERMLEELLKKGKDMEIKQKLTDILRTTKLKLAERHFDKGRSLEEQRDSQKARDMHLFALQLAEEALALSKNLVEQMDAQNLMTKIKLKMSIIDLLDGSISIHQDFLRKYADARKKSTEKNLKIAKEYCEKTKESYLKVQAQMQKLHEVFPQESHGLGKITDAIEALDLNAIDLNASMLVQAMKNIEGFQVTDEKQIRLDQMLLEEQKKMEKDRTMELLGLGDDPVEELVDIDE